MKRKRVPKVETVENNEKFPNAEPITRLRWEALPILNRIDRFYDFVMFVIADQDLMLSDEGRFFQQDSTDFSTFVNNYKDYIEKHLTLLPVDIYLEFFDDHSYEVKKFEDVVPKKYEQKFVNYFNRLFYENFPDEQFIGVSSLIITIEDLKNYFKLYLKFTKVNSEVYISYFASAFSFFYNDTTTFKKEAERLDKFKLHCESLDSALSAELKERKREEYKSRLYECINNGVTQVKGYIEDFSKKEVYLSFEENLIHYLKMLPEDFDNYTFISYGFNYDNRFNHLSLQYLDYTYFGIEPENLKGSQSEIEAIKIELDNLRSKNTKLINFLNEKGFNDKEINILFNLLHKNKFSTLNIRYHPFTKQVSQFHILYCFYIFEFYENALDSIKDFENLISDITVFNIGVAEQFRKYYRNLTSNNNHYPFTRFEKTIKDLNNKLNIDREKLKNIPGKNYGNVVF